jgi:hypothetical protein
VTTTTGLDPAAVTLLAWVRQTGDPGSYRYVAAKGADTLCGSTSYALYTGGPADPGPHFYVNVGVGGLILSPSGGTALWDGQYHLLAGTYDGTTVRLYVDGRQAAAGTPASGMIDYTLPISEFQIGHFPGADSCPFQTQFPGDIDEVRVYSRALTDTEIGRLATATGPDPPPLVPDGPGTGPGGPGPGEPGPGGPAPGERNATRPTITAEKTDTGPVYRCNEGTWEGLAPNPAFNVTWWRENSLPSLGPDGTFVGRIATRVASSPTYRLGPREAGASFYCQVEAHMQSGALLSAFSASTVLSGLTAVAPLEVSGRPYGDFRIRGIDVIQTVQPLPGAQMFGYNPSATFPSLCGGGTPTSFLVCAPGSTPSPQRTSYVGVPLDARKTTTAVVYVDMANTAASDATQPLNVTLRARVGGRLLGPSLTQQTANPPVSATPWVTSAERVNPKYGLQFDVPAAWLASAVLSGERLDLEASVGLPVGAGKGYLRECSLITTLTGPGCAADDRFRLDGVAVYDDLPELTIRSVPLVAGFSAAALAPPQTTLSKVVEVFPGGTRLNILPYNGSIDISSAVARWLFRKIPELSARRARVCAALVVAPLSRAV